MKIDGCQAIVNERKRQIEKEGWDAEHDKEHSEQELAWAAVCYAAPTTVTASKFKKMGQWNCGCRSWGECCCDYFYKEFENALDPWPWDGEWDKREKHDRLRQLAIAGALIAAEYDRIARWQADERG